MAKEIKFLPSPVLVCGEGPAWDSKTETLYYTESNDKCIYRYNEKKSAAEVFLQGTHAASLTPHSAGGLMTCGSEGFKYINAQNKIYSFNNCVNQINANKLNDIIADANGRVMAGQESFTEDGPYKPGYLFQLDINGNLTIIDEGFHLANGMGFSPDCASFYVTDTILRKIYKYKYDMKSGKISQKKLLIQFDREDGLPDGLTVDSEGFLWVAMFLGSKIIRVDCDGNIERSITLPFAQPTSLTFGGRNLDELYITSAGVLWETKLAPSAHDYNLPRGGNLYRIKLGFQGKEEYKAAINFC